MTRYTPRKECPFGTSNPSIDPPSGLCNTCGYDHAAFHSYYNTAEDQRKWYCDQLVYGINICHQFNANTSLEEAIRIANRGGRDSMIQGCLLLLLMALVFGGAIVAKRDKNTEVRVEKDD